MAGPGAEPPEEGSEAGTSPISQTDLDLYLKSRLGEGTVPQNDPDPVPLDSLWVEHRHQEQGIRVLVRPFEKDISGSNSFQAGSESCQWLTLRTDSPSLYKKPEHKVFAVTQTSNDIKFSFRIPGKAQHESMRAPLWCDLFYDPTGDNIIILNKSDIPFSLYDVSHSSKDGIIMNPGLTKSLKPGTWRIAFGGITILDFRILEKYPVMVYEHQPQTTSDESPTSGHFHGTGSGKSEWVPEENSWASGEMKMNLVPNEKQVLHYATSVIDRHKNEDATPAAGGADSLDLSMSHGDKKLPNGDIQPLLDADIGQTIAIPGVGELNEYKLEKLGPPISSTSLSAVYGAQHSKVSDLVAVKVLKTGVSNEDKRPNANDRNIIRQADTWMRECQVLADLRHKSIVQYYGSDSRFLSIYLEFIDAKDLMTSSVWRNKTNDEFQGNGYDALRILIDITSALSYVHGKNLTHNDTKPANILYSRERGAVLCDFGLSAPVHNPPTTGGTPYYIPPEFIGTKLRGPPSDVWAFGITMLYVLRKIPLPDSRSRSQHPQRLYWQISALNNPTAPHKNFGNGESAIKQMQQWLLEVKEAKETLDENNLLEGVVSKMLEVNPRRRITMNKLLQELAAVYKGTEKSSDNALAFLLDDALWNNGASANNPVSREEGDQSRLNKEKEEGEEDSNHHGLHSPLIYTQESEELPDMEDEEGLKTAVPPTDSGYASVPTMDGKPAEARKQSGQDTSQSQEVEEHDIGDTATEYSMGSSVTTSRKKGYIWELAEDLFMRLSVLNTDEKAQTRISEILPELLKAFALKVGQDAPTQMHRDVMAFVHKNRREIATAFTNISLKQEEENTQRSSDRSGGMDLTDLMSLWYQKEEVEDGRLEEELQDLDLDDLGPDQLANEALREVGETEDDEDSDNWLVAYRGFVSSCEAYQWLLSRLRREFRLVPTEPNSILTIRENVMAVLPPVLKVSRKVSSQTYDVNFEIDWDIFGFFETQQYFKQASEALEGVITLTGSYQDAQAATCAQYLLQTWPFTGAGMLELIKGVLGRNKGESHRCKLSDGTALSAVIDGSKLKVEAHGVAASIAEVGEQLAWLGAAFKASPRECGLVHCTPIIGYTPQSHTVSQLPGLQLPSTNLICEIGFIIEEVPDPQPLWNVNGQCWHDIFRNPVIVKGYPIPQRVEWNTGLEISLNIMAGLADTQRIDRFKDNIYLKGYSTLLVPTKKNQDIVSWHLIYNKDGSRISYLDDYLGQQHLGGLDLEGHRHVLGWCSEAKFYAGSAEAHHPVTHSQLPKPPAGFALSGVTVSAGKMIVGGPPFSIGVKDSAIHITRKGIIPRLRWISAKFVLLWDERDKRGWLINGTSALLHIVRASLAHASQDSFSSAFLFKGTDLQEAKEPHTTESAIEVLLNPRNRSLQLYEEDEEDGGFTLLKTQIDRFYNVLEKIIEHQMDVTGKSGVDLSHQPRRHLEGWDFEDLATDCDPLHPRVATLEPAGKGWVDFIRAIQAVTLVGSGFGDIIRPSGTEICEHWAELPKQQYYIAGCLADMGRLMKDVGDYGDNRVRLTDNLICHTPTTAFMSCLCRGVLSQDHSEPVQVLFPSAMAGELPTGPPLIEPKGSGAVIFGQSSGFPWTWGDIGDPYNGELTVERDTDSLRDSNFGRSSSMWSGSEAIFSPHSTRSTGPSIRSPSEFPASLQRLESSVLVDSKIYMPGEYTVGIICALPKELLAVRVLFDHRHNSLGTEPGDSNQYALGDMAGHWVVAACLPAGEYGTNSAASVASNMCRSFTSLRFCLLVGIAGGAPSEKRDIRLGDVVIGQPTGTNSGVLQYDRGKENEGSQFQLTGVLQPPPRVLTNAISSLQSDPDLQADPLGPYLRKIAVSLPEYRHPGPELDVLFPAACAVCASEQAPQTQCPHMLQRVPRATTAPAIHYGLVASGNRVVKDAAFRDRLAQEHDVLCFEMEAAGVINTVNCLVIRGICDYCDAKKNDLWQEYAAATAASYAKLLLSVVAGVGLGGARVLSTRGSFDEPASKKRKVEFERV